MKDFKFTKSKWVEDAKNPVTQKQISEKFPLWKSRVKNANLLDKAQELWTYFRTGESSAGDKILIAGALFYLISPIDLVPDMIPVVGWLDDIGVATYVLAFISGKISKKEMDDSINSEISNDSFSLVDSEKNVKNLNIPTINYNLEELKKVAEEIVNAEALESLLDIESSTMFDFCKIAVVGRYSTGKSTLINALLEQDLLPAKPIPTTKAVTYITKAAKEAMVSEDSMGNITIHDSLLDLKEEPDIIQQAVKINIQIAHTLWDANVSIVDTPGLEDPDMDIVKMTHELIPQMDALVMVLDASVGISRNELDFISKLMSSDRDKKLLLVLNRSDKVDCLSGLEALKESVCKDLKSIGIAHPKLYTVSARNVLLEQDAGEFDLFKRDLKWFLENGITAERQRMQKRRIAQVTGNLIGECEQMLILADQNESERIKKIEETQKSQAEIKAKLAQKKQIITKTVENAEMVFNANWQTFRGKLAVKLHRSIDQASLAELRDGSVVEDLVTESIRNFLEKELKKIHDELKVESDKVLLDARISIQEIDLPITQNYQTSYLEKNNNIIVPSMIVLTFPFLGLFAWLQIAVVGLLGRGVIDGLISGIAEHAGINKFRPKLKEEADQLLKKLLAEIDEKLASHFAMIKTDLSASFERAFNEQIGYLPSNEIDLENIDKSRYLQIKQHLESFQ